MASKAKSRGINTVLAAAESLPFKNNVFDFVLLLQQYVFFDNVQEAFNEAYRVLKNKGIIIIGFIDADSALGRKYSLKKESSRFYRDAEFYTADFLTACLRKAKFVNYEYRQTPFDGTSSNDIFKTGCGEGSFVAVKASKPDKI